jgi:hypothetical protein
MRTSSVLRAAWVAGCWVILASCGESTAPEPVPSAQVEALLQESLQAQTLGGTALASSGIFAVPSAQLPRGSCVWSDDFQGFDCPSRSSAGLSVHTSFQLLDASNAPLRAYDATKVAALRTVTDVTGRSTFTSRFDGSVETFDISAHEDGTLSGLLTDRHVLNSIGTSRTTITSPAGTATMRSKQTTTDLVLSSRPNANPYPSSGTISSEAYFGDDQTPTTRVTMTFNGTSTVAIVLTFGSVTQSCTLDLAQRPSLPVCG